jgi:hypothetical protein
MRKINHLYVILFILFCVPALRINAQVKIGGTPGAAHPSAVLEVDGGTNKGLLLPRLTNAQMGAIASPQDGLMIYNTDKRTPYVYRLAETRWAGVYSDSSEWRYDTSSKRLYLRRALIGKDSIFYDSTSKKFVFADKVEYVNSLGSSFPVTTFSGKYYFKSTASQYRDSLNSGGPATLAAYMEVDSTTDPYFVSNSFRAFNAVAVTNPLAKQQVGALSAGVFNTIYAGGADTGFTITGINNSTSANGKGYTGTLTGIFNSMRMGDSLTKNVNGLIGIRNISINSLATTAEVEGNFYGYLSSMSGFTNKINGNAYGIFLGSIAGSKIRNYGIYTSLGINRFGDSVLISNTGSVAPRAIFDINNTTAMIPPTGITAQRPATAVTGMLRYNVETTSIEAYNGTFWHGTVKASVLIDVPNMAAASGVTLTVSVPAATTGGSAVFVSPDASLPNRMVVAWARQSAPGTIEIRFENLNTAASLDPPAINYNIRVIQ